MIKEIRTLVLLLCAAAFTLGSCAKQSITPEEEQGVIIGFTPVSETAQVKATTPLSAHHSDFGVWGIAREQLNSPYILWEENALTQVNKSSTDDNTYIPTENAYWFKGFTYNFIAVAPYTNSGIAATTIDKDNNTLSFTYNIADKYSSGDYDFDLMAAVAQTDPYGPNVSPTQQLIFWHLFSQININVSFANLGTDANRNAITGAVSQMRLHNIDSQVNYTITNSGNDLVVTCSTVTGNTQQNISFAGNSGCINVLPQNITDFEFFIDFTIGGVKYEDYKVNLNNGTNPSDYRYNGKYNWNLTIGPKAAVSFKVTVEPWQSQNVGDGDSDNNDDIEIV